MKTEKMKVLLYLKKSGKDKQGKAPIMGRITFGRNIAQFSCKLSCDIDLWSPRESRMRGKSREAVEVNGKLDSLVLPFSPLIKHCCPKDRHLLPRTSRSSFKGAYNLDVCYPLAELSQCILDSSNGFIISKI